MLSSIRLLSFAAAAAALQGCHALQLSAHGSRTASPRMQFGDFKNPFANPRDGATTVSITFSFQCADRGPNSVLGQLDELASAADTSTADGFSALCSDTALMLLRREGQWLACCGSAEHSKDEDIALATFDRLAIREAAKFEDRTPASTIDSALAAAGVTTPAKVSPPTMAVVCVLACLAGDSEERVPKNFNGNGAAARSALEELNAAGKADQEVLALELFWVPGEAEEELDADEIILDWPELMTC
jgi:uncharacterized membrane protein